MLAGCSSVSSLETSHLCLAHPYFQSFRSWLSRNVPVSIISLVDLSCFHCKAFLRGNDQEGRQRDVHTPAHSDEQGPLSVCWIHKVMGASKSHLRFQKTNVSVPVATSSSEGRGGWGCSDPGASGKVLPEWPRAVGAAQVLPQLCPITTKIWLCIAYPAGGIVGLSFGSSPADPAGVPGDSGAPQGGIPWNCVFSLSSVIFSMVDETGSSPSTTLLHWGHTGRVLFFFRKMLFDLLCF